MLPPTSGTIFFNLCGNSHSTQWAVRGGVDPKFWKSFFWSQWLLIYPYQVILEYFDDQSTVSSIFLSSKLAKSAKTWKIGIFAMFGSIFQICTDLRLSFAIAYFQRLGMKLIKIYRFGTQLAAIGCHFVRNALFESIFWVKTLKTQYLSFGT